jgi:hypothetical protein
VHLLVGIDDPAALFVVAVADRQRDAQLAALSSVAAGAVHAHGHHVQLRLGQLTLDPEDELIVEVAQVIDPIGVDHQRVGQPAVLKQPLGLGGRARQARDLKPEDRADLAQAHARDQLLERPARPTVREPARDAEVAVDGQDLLRRPAELDRLLGQRVLALGRADVLAHLPRRGLSQVNDRQPLPMRACDLLPLGPGHRLLTQSPRRACSPSHMPPRRRCPPPLITAAPAA